MNVLSSKTLQMAVRTVEPVTTIQLLQVSTVTALVDTMVLDVSLKKVPAPPKTPKSVENMVLVLALNQSFLEPPLTNVFVRWDINQMEI